MLGKILRVISLFSLLCVVANAEGEVDPFVADPEGGPPAGPDHLCPLENLDDGWWKSYQAKLKAKLELGDFAFARMVSCPSFEGESVVLIHGQEKDQDPE